MKALKGLVTILVLVIVFTISVVFVRFNSELTSIFFGGFKVVELPLSVLVLGAFLIGSIIGLLFGLRIVKYFKMKAEIKRLKRLKLK